MTQEPPSSAKHGHWRWALVVVLFLLAGGAVGIWWPRPAPPSPPMPRDIQDLEVRQVIERVRQEVVAEPHSAAAWGHLGMTLLAHLFDQEADRCFAEAARLDPSELLWPYGRALIALKRDPDNAVPLLRQALAAGGATPSQHRILNMQLAEALLERRELAEAEQLFRDELRGRKSPRAALGLGMALLAQDKRKEAIPFFEAARGSPSARKQATSQLAALARDRGDSPAATAYEKEAAAMPADQVWPDPLLDQIVSLQVGRRGRQRRVAQLEEQHRYAEAAREYLEEIEQQPTARAHIGVGINLARLKDYDRAVPHLREAVRLDKDSAKGQYTLALVLFSMAEKEWHHTPGSDRAKKWFGEAIERARRAAELKPDHADAYLFWGMSLKYLGKPAEAVVVLRKGTACRPDDFNLQFGLGEALLEVGQKEEAKTHLENARRLDPKDPRPGQILDRLLKEKE
jgi:tetratricopeptide (TPR) repeat protein